MFVLDDAAGLRLPSSVAPHKSADGTCMMRTHPPTALRCSAILFDLDGVLVDSAECVRHVCIAWATGRGLDPDHVLRIGQGRRVFETVRLVAPHLDADAEAATLIAMEETTVIGLRATTGADRLLRSIPDDAWAVVTSGTRNVAELRLRTAGLPIPEVLVTAEDVREGKPHPEGYLAAARQMGCEVDACVVIEDAPAGIEAARQAGMRCIAVAGTFPADALSGATTIVASLDTLRVRSLDAAAHGGPALSIELPNDAARSTR